MRLVILLLSIHLQTQVTEGILCPWISKMIAATDRGLLFVFPGALHNQMDREHSLAGEQVEAKHMIKVAHEVRYVSLCVFCW